MNIGFPFKYASLGLLLYWLGACASMSEDECRVANWQQIGWEDGSKGYTLDNISRHRKSCAKAGIAPDFDLYKVGHAEGLVSYCNYDNGLRLGMTGSSYNGVCPAHLAADFLTAYNKGLARHAQAQVLNALRTEIKNLKQSIADKDARVSELEELATSDDWSEDERRDYLREMRAIEHSLVDMDAMLYDLELDFEKEQRRYQRLLKD